MKKLVLSLFVIIFIFLITLDSIVSFSYNDYNCRNIEMIPNNTVGLVLGAPRKNFKGQNNEYFDNRIEAAKELYYANKINKFVVSGDLSQAKDMKQELIREGIPKNNIIIDSKGYRTIYSIVNFIKSTNNRNLTIISQNFHNERALFIAHHYGLDAYAYRAPDVDGLVGSFQQEFVRESLARVKLFYELFL